MLWKKYQVILACLTDFLLSVKPCTKDILIFEITQHPIYAIHEMHFFNDHLSANILFSYLNIL